LLKIAHSHAGWLAGWLAGYSEKKGESALDGSDYYTQP